jgi:hypothetical protein
LGRRRTAEKQEGWAGMGRIFKAVLALGFIGLGGYAYLGDMTPPQTQVTQPVMLNAD